LLTEAETAARAWQTNVSEPAIKQLADSHRTDATPRSEIELEGKKRFDAFRNKIGLIDREARDVLDRLNDNVGRAEFTAELTLYTSTGLTLLICVGIGLAINRMIAQPLVELASVMRRLADRDLSVEVPHTTYSNEVGEMANAISVLKNNMV